MFSRASSLSSITARKTPDKVGVLPFRPPQKQLPPRIAATFSAVWNKKPLRIWAKSFDHFEESTIRLIGGRAVFNASLNFRKFCWHLLYESRRLRVLHKIYALSSSSSLGWQSRHHRRRTFGDL